MSTDSVDVFISYAREDHAHASAIKEALTDGGYSVWGDWLLNPGEKWTDVIVDALEACTVLVVLVSEYAARSDHVDNEVAVAGDRKTVRPIFLPALLEPTQMSGNLRYWLARAQWINLYDHSQPEWPEVVVRAVAVQLGPRAAEVAEVGSPQAPSDYRELPVFNGRYQLHRQIGRGGMAVVYLAHDQLLDRPVAVKVINPDLARDPSFVERFRREAAGATNLNHPNIVSVFDWGEEDGTYYIVMEYIDGRPLDEILAAEGPLHPDRAADVAMDIAAGLALVHRSGLVHGDLKPGNVMISMPSGKVKVIDSGIAEMVAGDSGLTQMAVLGTPSYYSPERVQGKRLDARSDLYSLGVVLYEMVVGRPPFTGDTPVAIAYQHVQEPPPPPQSINTAVPLALEAIILKLLTKDPVLRYPSAEDLRADLRRFRKSATLPAASQPAEVEERPTERTRFWRRGG